MKRNDAEDLKTQCSDWPDFQLFGLKTFVEPIGCGIEVDIHWRNVASDLDDSTLDTSGYTSSLGKNDVPGWTRRASQFTSTKTPLPVTFKTSARLFLLAKNCNSDLKSRLPTVPRKPVELSSEAKSSNFLKSRLHYPKETTHERLHYWSSKDKLVRPPSIHLSW